MVIGLRRQSRYLPGEGCGRGLAWEEEIVSAAVVLAGLRIWVLPRARVGLWRRLPYRNPLRVRIAGKACPWLKMGGALSISGVAILGSRC